jgi:hypothetical protein
MKGNGFQMYNNLKAGYERNGNHDILNCTTYITYSNIIKQIPIEDN